MKNIIILCFLALALTQINAEAMNKIKLPKSDYPEAVCLDGSRYGFYWQDGSGDGQDKFIIFFEGGGACLGTNHDETLQACLQRSKGPFGSSLWRPNKWNAWGILQDNEDHNPEFHNWNKVYVFYCNGTVHQGYKKEPWEVNGKKIYIRGLVGTYAIFDYLVKNKGLAESSVKEVLLTGSSAGGLATFFYADYLSELLHPNTKYWAAPDSGFFINFLSGQPDNYMEQVTSSLFSIIEKDLILPKQCRNSSDLVNCTLPVNFAADIKSDLYIVMSEYDSFNIRVFVGIQCAKHRSFEDCSKSQKQEIQDFRKSMIKQISAVVEAKENANAWTVACSQHTFWTFNGSYNNGIFQVPENSGNLSQKTLYEWMYANPNDRVNNIDSVEWPNNQPCNGIQNDQFNFSDFIENFEGLHEMEKHILASQQEFDFGFEQIIE